MLAIGGGSTSGIGLIDDSRIPDTITRDTELATAIGGVVAKGALVLNVKDYGATGNGTTDDTTAIQAALDAVPTGGGTVFLPAGRYKVSSTLTVRTHATTVQGVVSGHSVNATHNPSGTRLEATGTLSSGPMLLTQTVANTQPLFGCVLRDLILDGMGTATGVGVHWRSYRSLIHRVFVARFGSHGIKCEGYTGWWLYDSLVSYVQVNACETGVYVGDQAADMHMIHSVLFENNHNFRMDNSSSWQVTGCHFWAATTHDIYLNGGGTRAKFSNCKIEGSGQHGINIDTTVNGIADVQFVGCNISQNGVSATNTYDHLIVQGTTSKSMSRLTVVGCNFSWKGTGNLPRYAINLGAVAWDATIVGNSLAGTDHYGTKAVLDASPSGNKALIRANGGSYVTRATGNVTVAAGATTAIVNHGLSVTPTSRNLAITPTNNLGSATRYWVSAVSATSFTITVDAAPGGSGATFAWQIDV